MKYILTLAFWLLSSLAFAGGLDTQAVDKAGFDKLTEQQKAAILQSIANQAGTPNELGNPKKVDEWLDVGQKIGKMFGGAAKEIGVAVNDFVGTPVGKWTMALIVWKFIGNVIMHAFGGLLALCMGLMFIWVIVRRGQTIEIQYSEDKTNLFGFARRTHYIRSKLSDEDRWLLGCAAVITVVVALLATFTY